MAFEHTWASVYCEGDVMITALPWRFWATRQGIPTPGFLGFDRELLSIMLVLITAF